LTSNLHSLTTFVQFFFSAPARPVASKARTAAATAVLITSFISTSPNVAHWCSQNIKAMDCPHRQKQAERFAALCLREARRIGIPEGDLREAAYGDLVEYMLKEMDAVARGE
jgi:hypothetical protein